MTTILTWKEIVKLGKKELCFRLMARQAQFDSRGNYFSLCKIFNDSQHGSYTTITEASLAKLAREESDRAMIHEIALKSGNRRAASEALKAYIKAAKEHDKAANKHFEEQQLQWNNYKNQRTKSLTNNQ